jgi:hypothetical protein
MFFKPTNVICVPIKDHGSKIELHDLIASREIVIESVDVFGKMKELKVIKEQLYPMGLALLASYYNKRGDQNCLIYVASQIEDLQSMLKKIIASKNSEKAVIIFHPNHCDEKLQTIYPRNHRCALYAEKQDDVLHILNADAVANELFEHFFKLMIYPILTGCTCIYYNQQQIRDPGIELPVFLSNDFINCATHAFRFARSAAKNENFISGLKITEEAPLTKELKVARYQLPLSFAKNAESTLARQKLAEIYGDEFIPLANHFLKYPGGHDYIDKFSEKNLRLVRELYAHLTPEELVQRIDEVDARNFPSDSLVSEIEMAKLSIV